MLKHACVAAVILVLARGATDEAASQGLSDLPPWARVQRPVPLKALVLGLNEYDRARPLTTPSHDADKMAQALSQLRFAVTRPAEQRLDREGLIRHIRAFKASLNEGDIAVVFFSGHGVARHGRDFLVPSPAGAAEEGREAFDYVSLDFVLSELTSAGAAVAVVVLDACRTSAFDLTAPEPYRYQRPVGGAARPSVANSTPPAPSSSAEAAVRPVIPAAGVVVAYAAERGRAAYTLIEGEDPSTGSLYTRNLVNELTQADASIYDILSEASVSVRTSTDDQQKPWWEAGGTPAIAFLSSPARAHKAEQRWIDTAMLPEDGQGSALKDYLRRFPDSPFAGAARARLRDLLDADARRLTVATAAAVHAQPQSQAIAAFLMPPAGVTATDIALAEPLYASAPGQHLSAFSALAGALSTPSILTSQDTALTATATRQVRITSTIKSKSRILGGSDSGYLRAGATVKVLDVYPEITTAKVQTDDGSIGFIKGITLASAAPAVLETSYAPEAEAPPFSGAQVAHLQTVLQRPYSSIIVKVGPASTGKPGVSEQLQFDRALNLVRQAAEAGADRQKIKLDLTSTATADTAEIRVVP